MSDIIVPKWVRFIGLLVNALSFDTYVVNNSELSVIMLPSYGNKNYTLLHHFGKMQITMFTRKFKYRPLYDNNLVLLNLHNVYDCFTSTGSITRMTKAYLSNADCVKSLLKKIERIIQNHYFVSLGAYILELFACLQNLYEKYDTDIYLKKIQSLVKKFKYIHCTLDCSDYIKKNILGKANHVIEILYTNIEQNKYYYPVIVQDVTTVGKNGVLYNHSIVPIVIFIEYVYDKKDIEKLLEKFENILVAISLGYLTNDTAIYLLEFWYLTFKIAYEQQKNKQDVRILQPYIPYFYGELEIDLRKDDLNEFLAPISTPQVASVYSLMPLSLISQIIGSISSDINNMRQFLDVLNVLTTTSYTISLNRNQAFIQHIVAYYSDLLSYAFNSLKKR